MLRYAGVLSLVLMAGCDKPASPPVAEADQGAAEQVQPAPDASVDKELPDQPTAAGKAIARLDSNLVFHQKQAEAKGGWLHHARIAGTHLARGRLTGRIDDYVDAGKALERAFEVAKPDTGPFFERAHYNYTIHRIADVEADLANDENKIVRHANDKARTAGLRGDLAFHRGDLDAARQKYREALTHKKTFATVARLAWLDLKTDRVDWARKGYEEAIKLARGDKQQRAWAELHRGVVELEIADVGAALSWFERANKTFDGWYLIEEHIAEAFKLLGRVDEAIAVYDSVVARVPNGEFMAALAECHELKGDTAAAAEWHEKARAAFERDLQKLPSAASGHAVEYFLVHDRARALELARDNFDLRPGHEARMFYAQALVAAGKRAKAQKILRPVLDTAWSTADFAATAAIVFQGTDRATALDAKADPATVTELREALGLEE